MLDNILWIHFWLSIHSFHFVSFHRRHNCYRPDKMKLNSMHINWISSKWNKRTKLHLKPIYWTHFNSFKRVAKKNPGQSEHLFALAIVYSNNWFNIGEKSSRAWQWQLGHLQSIWTISMIFNNKLLMKTTTKKRFTEISGHTEKKQWNDSYRFLYGCKRCIYANFKRAQRLINLIFFIKVLTNEYVKYALNLIDVQIIHVHAKFARLSNRFYFVCETCRRFACVCR